MDYDDLYEYTFSNLLSKVRRSRVGAEERTEHPDKRWHLLFDLGNSRTEEEIHTSVYASLRYNVPRAMGDLLIMMLARLDHENGARSVIPIRGSLNDSRDGSGAPHFAIDRNGMTTGFICCNRCSGRKELSDLGAYEKIRHFQGLVLKDIEQGLMSKDAGIADCLGDDGLPQLDEITCLLMTDLKHRDADRQKLERYNDLATHGMKRPVSISYELFSDFFARHFGEDELIKLATRIEDFNQQVWEEASVGTVTVPTRVRMDDLKEEYSQRIVQESNSYRSELLDLGVDGSQIDEIEKRYFGEEYYRSLVGSAEFADSFMSSEWLRDIHHITDVLDQTGTVAGYIKSIEQLLYWVAYQWIGRGKRLPKKDGIQQDVGPGEQFVKGKGNPRKLDFWTLSKFFDTSVNTGLLEVTDDTSRVMQDLLDGFRQNERNGYFHKDNLHSRYNTTRPSEVEKIRHQAMLLHFLILGSCVITERCAVNLGIPLLSPSIDVVERDLDSSLHRWVVGVFENPIFRYRVSTGAEAVVFAFDHDGRRETDLMEVFVKREGTSWRLELSVYEHESTLYEKRLVRRQGVYKALPIEWQHDNQREDMLNVVAETLMSLDWDALLSWAEERPKLLLLDTIYGTRDLRTGA